MWIRGGVNSPSSQAHTSGFVKLFSPSEDATVGKVAFFQPGEPKESFAVHHPPYGQMIRNAVVWLASPVQNQTIVSSLIVSPGLMTNTGMAGNFNVTVASNISWTLTGVPLWMTAATASGYGNLLINFGFMTNPSHDIRSALLTLSGSGLQSVLTITQLGTIGVTATGVAHGYHCQLPQGAVTLLGLGGLSPYEYSLNGTSWQSSNVYSALPAGTYTPYVRSANMIAWTAGGASFVLTAPSSPTISLIHTKDVSNCGSMDGAVTIVGSGSNGTLEYSLNGMIWQSQAIFKNLTPASYTPYLRRQAEFCSVSGASFLITTPSTPSISGILRSASLVCPISNGSVTLLGMGISALEYRLYPLDWSSGNVFSDLDSGSYTPMIRLASAPLCTFVGSQIPVTVSAYVLSIDTNNLTFNNFTNTRNLQIASNTFWKWINPYKWIKIGDTSGYCHRQVSIQVDSAQGGLSRIGVLSIIGGGQILLLTITQNFLPDSRYLSISEDEFIVRPQGDILPLTIYSNTSWTIQVKGNLIQSPISNGQGKADFLITVLPNFSIDPTFDTLSIYNHKGLISMVLVTIWGRIDASTSVVGVEEYDKFIFPNPSSHGVKVRISHGHGYRLFNLVGEVVQESLGQEIDTSGLMPGICIVHTALFVTKLLIL